MDTSLGTLKQSIAMKVLKTLFKRRFNKIYDQCIELFPVYKKDLPVVAAFLIEHAIQGGTTKEALLNEYVLEVALAELYPEIKVLQVQYVTLTQQYNTVKATIANILYECDSAVEVLNLFGFIHPDISHTATLTDAEQAHLAILRDTYKEDLAVMKRHLLLSSM